MNGNDESVEAPPATLDDGAANLAKLRIAFAWYDALTPEERGWMLERNLRVARWAPIVTRLFRRVTDDPMLIAIGLKSYKWDGKTP